MLDRFLPHPSPFERLLARGLRPFAKVEPAEAVTASGMLVIVLLLMTAYYLLKTAREPLILLQGGAEVKLYAEAGQALLLIGVVRAYSAIARRVGRLKLLATVYLFFASNMVVFAVLARTRIHIGLAFFLWVGIFSYTSIAQFWAFAADIYSEDQGKRLFPIVGVGSSVGAVVGARAAKAIVPFGAYALMYGAALLVVVCVLLLAWVDRRARADDAKAGGHAKVQPDEPVGDDTPLRLLARDKYLILIGALTLILNCVSGLGDYILDRTLLSHLGDARALGMSPTTFIGSFKASYFGWYNLVGVVLQLFVVSRILLRYGVRGALLCLPVVASMGFCAFTLVPVLPLIRAVMIAERSLDYSLTNTSRNALFLVATRVEKYVGKTLVDTVGARSGDVVSAFVVLLGTRIGMPTAGFSAICVCFTGAWIAVVVAIGVEHQRRIASS
jgi:AAA family ATP:ADP antiporter